MFEKKIKIIFTALFCISLLLPLLFLNGKSSISETENRSLAAFPRFHSDDGKLNANIFSEFENWFNDHLGFRSLLFSMNAHIQYDIFRNSISDKVVIGKDDWLFYNAEDNIQIAADRYPGFGSAEIETVTKQQQVISDVLSSRGVEYVLFFPPSKVSIYPEKISGNFHLRETIVDRFEKSLREKTDTKFIPVKTLLLEEKNRNESPLYWKTDTHWNYQGAYITYCQIIDQCRDWGFLNEENLPAEGTYIEQPFPYGTSQMIGLTDKKYYENGYNGFALSNPQAEMITEGPLYENLKTFVKAQDNISQFSLYHNNHIDGPSVILLHDSFSTALIPLLAENFSSLATFWTPFFNPELIDLLHPDIILYEMTERYLNSLNGAENDVYQADIQIKNENIEINYYDFGSYPAMEFCVWTDDTKEDKVTYPAIRKGEWAWTASIRLVDLPASEQYHIESYKIEDGNSIYKDYKTLYLNYDLKYR